MTTSRTFPPVTIGVAWLAPFRQLHQQRIASLTEAEPLGDVARRQERLEQIRTKLTGVEGRSVVERTKPE